MVDFAALAVTAQRLVEANARQVTLRRANTAPASAGEPWRGPAGTIADGSGGATLAVLACFVPPGGAGMGRELRSMIGALTVDADQIALIASRSAGTDLSSFETVLDGGRTWKIVRADELRPASVSLLWVLYLKA